MSLAQRGADRNAERVCDPSIGIGDRADSSAQPADGVADEPS